MDGEAVKTFLAVVGGAAVAVSLINTGMWAVHRSQTRKLNKKISSLKTYPFFLARFIVGLATHELAFIFTSIFVMGEPIFKIILFVFLW